MIIKEAVFENCRTCDNRKRVSNETYGCDNCRKLIDYGGKERSYLDVTMHHHIEPPKHMQFCSWKCVIAKLKTIRTDYFVALPFLSYDEKQKGIRAIDFFKAIGK